MEDRNYVFTNAVSDYQGSLQGAISYRAEHASKYQRIFVEVNLVDHTCDLCGHWLDGGGTHLDCAIKEQAKADAETEAPVGP